MSIDFCPFVCPSVAVIHSSASLAAAPENFCEWIIISEWRLLPELDPELADGRVVVSSGIRSEIAICCGSRTNYEAYNTLNSTSRAAHDHPSTSSSWLPTQWKIVPAHLKHSDQISDAKYFIYLVVAFVLVFFSPAVPNISMTCKCIFH